MSVVIGYTLKQIGAFINSIYRLIYTIKENEMHVWGILFKCRPPLGTSREENMIKYHKAICSASEVLKGRQYILNLTESQVVLVECKNDVYNLERHPFFIHAIFDEAVWLKSLRIDDFLTYVESLEYPNIEVLFLWSIGRCGSTMLAACFEALDGCVSISEPADIFEAWIYRKEYGSELYQRLLEATLKYHLYQVRLQKPHTKLVLIKPFSFTFWYATQSNNIQRFHHIFMYRDLDSYLESSAIFTKVFGKVRPLKRFSFIANAVDFERIIDEGVKSLINAVALFSQSKANLIMEELEKEMYFSNCMTAIGTPTLYYIYTQLEKLDKINLISVRYEDVQADIVSVFQQLLTHINRTPSDEELQRVISSKSKDSQANTTLSSFNKTKLYDPLMPRRHELACNVLKILDLEYMTEKGAKLPKTIVV